MRNFVFEPEMMQAVKTVAFIAAMLVGIMMLTTIPAKEKTYPKEEL